VEELAVVRDLRFGPETLADVERLVDAAPARVEVEPGREPLLLEPAGADAELEPSAGDDVDRLHAARGDERMAQPEVVDVRAEPDAFGAAGEVGEVGEGVEDGDRRGHGRVLLTRMG
jgi:hypothetical protein